MLQFQNNWLNKKSLLIFLGAILSILVLLTPGKALGYGYNWDIPSFNTDITVREDGSFLVKETLEVDFSREEHHGIFRTIPVQYRDANNQTLKLRYNVVSVQDQNGNNWQYQTSREGDYLKVKIGDPDRYLQESVTFIITYEIQRAVSFQFDDHDEIYWNATGDKWAVPILESSATIHLPTSVNAEDLRATCFTGAYGSNAQECEFHIEGNSISYDSLRAFNPYEGLTIVAGFPKGILEQASLPQQLLWFFTDNWPYIIPFITFFILFYLWYTRGKDPATNRDTVMPHYEAPEDITPAEAGTLIDEKVDMHDLSSTIIDMAVRGYLKIKETKKKKLLWGEESEYEFIKMKEFNTDSKLQKHEQKTLEAIFGTGQTQKLSGLKNKFYKDLPTIKQLIYNSLVSKGYFPRDPEKTRQSYWGTGIFMIMGPLFLFGAFIDTGFISLPISIGISGMIVMAFANHMPAKTKKGVDAYYKILGLEEYINTAEADRIKFQERENLFMKLLPYAMAFTIADRWSKAFEGLNKIPNWYESDDPNMLNNFNTHYFINRLNGMSTQMNTAFTSAPRSSGSSGFSGGSSGGGFGGGGGGSW